MKKVGLPNIKQGGQSLFAPEPRDEQQETQEASPPRVHPEALYEGPYPPQDRPTICCNVRAWVWNGEQYKCGACYKAETRVSEKKDENA